MESLRHLGRNIPEVVGPTYRIYESILAEHGNAAAVRDTCRTTFSYGPHERQKLDFYEAKPKDYALTSGHKGPVLFFVYGGGFVSGDRVISEIRGDLVYTNVGAFFAKKFGLEVIILDYRLIQHGARFPSGAEDLNQALQWATNHFAQEERDLFVMGNSAGGVHVATWLFAEQYARPRRRLLNEAVLRLRGVIFLGTPLVATPEIKQLLLLYYGDEEAINVGQPISLMKNAFKEGSIKAERNWPETLILVSELDPESLFDATAQFKEAWEGVGGKAEMRILKGHNHISPPLSLGTNIEAEEAWGCELGQWIATVVGKKS